jgi:transposase
VLPECLDEWVEESNSVRVVDSFVDALDLADLGFEGIQPAATGRPAYHPSVLLKLFGAKGFVSVAIARRWNGRARLPADGRTNHRMVRNYRRRLRRRQKYEAHQDSPWHCALNFFKPQVEREVRVDVASAQAILSHLVTYPPRSR